ncbi:MAG: rod shape-determining protein MreC [bacterium]|nr:rod shape-determining protein MreC [bacterium]
MNFLRPNSGAKSARASRAFLVLVVALAVFLGGDYLTDGAVRTVFRTMSAVVWQRGSAAEEKAASAVGTLTSREALIRERDALKEQVAELEMYALNNLALRAENDSLRALFEGTGNEQPQARILARVLSHAGEYPFGTLVIEQRDGSVREGAVVYSEYGLAIGTVSEAGGSYALVRLFSAPGEVLDVLVGGSGNTHAMRAEGHGSGNFTAQSPRGAELLRGDPVTLTTAHGALIGVVGAVEIEPADAFQLVRIRVPVQISTLRFVSVEK